MDINNIYKTKRETNYDAKIDTSHQDYAQHADMLMAEQRKTDLLNGKKDIKLNYELLTESIKYSEGRIIEPARYLDANPYNPNFELQMLFQMLPKNQQEAFLQVMREAVDKLNTNIDIKKGENNKKVYKKYKIILYTFIFYKFSNII